VHINLVVTSSILRFEDCLHSSFGLLRADRCSTNELCLLESDDFHFQRGILGPSITVTECQMTGVHERRKYDAWAWRFRRSWRSESVAESGNGEWWETEIKRVLFMVLNISKQCPPVFLVQVGLKRGKLPRSEEGKMIQVEGLE